MSRDLKLEFGRRTTTSLLDDLFLFRLSWCLVLTCATGRQAVFIVASRVGKLDGVPAGIEAAVRAEA